jgi:hypothetical protein
MQQPQHEAGEDQGHCVGNGQTLHRDRHGRGHNEQQDQDGFCFHYSKISQPIISDGMADPWYSPLPFRLFEDHTKPDSVPELFCPFSRQ